MAIKNIYDTEISAVSFTWNGNTIATQAWVNANVSTPTLDAVTTVGNTTANNINVGPSFHVGQNISTAAAYVQLGNGRTGNGYAYIDLVGDTTYTDYGLRVIRYNTGANAASVIDHRGTGAFTIETNEAAPIAFKTTNAERMRILPAGQVAIGRTTAFTVGGTAKLSVNGDLISWGNSSTDLSYFRRLSTGNFQWQTYNGANAGNIHLQPYGGNVGIATTSPKSTAHIDGVLTLEGGARSNPSAGINEAVVIDYQTSGVSLGRLRSRDWDNGVWKDFIIQANDITLDADGILDIQSSAYFSGSTNSGRLYADNFGLKVGTSSGYIQFGPANTTWAHIYTDRPNFYFNKNLFVLGNRLATESWVTGQGYLTSYTETDTLDSVTGRGNTTTNNIGVGLIELSGDTEHRLYRATTSLIKGTTTDTTILTGRTLDLYAYDDVNIRAGSSDNISFTAGGVSNAMYINSSGNVGIGTTSPQSKLHVQGPITVSNTNPLAYYNSGWVEPWQAMMTVGWGTTPGDYLILRAPGNSATAHGAVQIGDNLFKVGRTDTEYDQPATDDLDTTWMMANSTGVGIGTTSPSVNLQTGDGSAGLNTSIRAYHSDGTYTEMRGYGIQTNRTTAYIRPTGDKNAVMAFGNDGRTWNYVNVNTNYFVVGTDTAEHMRITSAGNVGIGTTSPTTALDVVGEGKFSSYLNVESSTGIRSTAGWVHLQRYQTNLHVAVGNNGSGVNFYVPNGNVGIGTASPSRRLDVDGIQGWQLSNLETAYLNPTATGTDFALKDQYNANIIRLDSRPNAVSYFNGGNVGIGTTSPNAMLHVTNSIQADGGNTFGVDNAGHQIYMSSGGSGLGGEFGTGYARNLIKSDGSATIHIGDNTSLISRILLDAGSAGVAGYISLQTKQAERVRVNGDGNVGIGETSIDARLHITTASAGLVNQKFESVGSAAWRIGIPAGSTSFVFDNANDNLSSAKLSIDASGNLTAAGDVTAYSDARLKENVETLPNALESVKAMRGVTYNKIGEEKESIGVIAQEVQAVLPQLVSEHKDEMLSVAYGNITAVLIEAVKELTAKVESLEEQLKNK